MSFTAPASVVLTLCLTGGSVFAVDQQQPSGPSPRTVSSAAPQPSVLEGLSGLWDYNAELSVDAATGRPEQAPRSAAARPGCAAGEHTGRSASGDRRRRYTGCTEPERNECQRHERGRQWRRRERRRRYDEARRAMAILLAAERRTLLRDLLEVPEKLTIRAAAETLCPLRTI